MDDQTPWPHFIIPSYLLAWAAALSLRSGVGFSFKWVANGPIYQVTYSLFCEQYDPSDVCSKNELVIWAHSDDHLCTPFAYEDSLNRYDTWLCFCMLSVDNIWSSNIAARAIPYWSWYFVMLRSILYDKTIRLVSEAIPHRSPVRLHDHGHVDSFCHFCLSFVYTGSILVHEVNVHIASPTRPIPSSPHWKCTANSGEDTVAYLH